MAFEQLMAEAAVKKGKDGKEDKKEEKKDTKKTKKDEVKKDEPGASPHHHGFHSRSKSSEPSSKPT